MDDIELHEDGRSCGLPDVEGARDGAIDPNDLPGTCRRSLYEVRSQLNLGRLLHQDWGAFLELNRDLALKGAAGRHNE